jgi:hypothetical protein
MMFSCRCVVLFVIFDSWSRLLLAENNRAPFGRMLALPWGIVYTDPACLDKSIDRLLYDLTGWRPAWKQLVACQQDCGYGAGCTVTQLAYRVRVDEIEIWRRGCKTPHGWHGNWPALALAAGHQSLVEEVVYRMAEEAYGQRDAALVRVGRPGVGS